MSAIRSYDFAMTALGGFDLAVKGNFLRLMAATGALEVSLDDGGYFPILPGQGWREFYVGGGWNRIQLRDTSGNINIGRIMIGEGEFLDQRIAGDVSVIDGEKARTLASGAFVGTPFNATPTAAQFPYVQLWNPAGSGKNLIVKQVSVTAGVAQPVNFQIDSVARATDQTATRAFNKLLGAAMGVGQVRQETNVTGPSSAGWGGAFALNTLNPWPLAGPVVVPPGKGLTGAGSATNSGIQVNYEWFEEPQ